jgi:WhiB family redox-sensing transcriptional regulator
LRARCRGLPAEVFFTTDDDRGSRRIAHEENAKRICRDCPVLRECLSHAIQAKETYGIWGATTPKERVALQRCMPPAVAGGPVRIGAPDGASPS